jgi:uracil-DNA glycosylase family 4
LAGILQEIGEAVVACRRCPRLIAHIQTVAERKVRRYRNWEYWGRPLPGFGDPEARLFILGLAPAAHGGNRTGRMFTGDSSGDWLIRALYETGFANQPHSVSLDDGLRLRDTYITAVVRCAPPGNRPTVQEIANCHEYWVRELAALSRVRVVLTLGRVAFETFLHYTLPAKRQRPAFRHGGTYPLPGGLVLKASYHPSRQNTQTGRLTWPMWIQVFREVRALLG